MKLIIEIIRRTEGIPESIPRSGCGENGYSRAATRGCQQSADAARANKQTGRREEDHRRKTRADPQFVEASGGFRCGTASQCKSTW